MSVFLGGPSCCKSVQLMVRALAVGWTYVYKLKGHKLYFRIPCSSNCLSFPHHS